MMKVFAGVVLVSALEVLPCRAASATVAFEAESGVLGAEMTNGTSSAVQFISAATDRINNGNPGSSNRVVTYPLAFPAGSTYQLYARLRVGPDPGNDDSLFYAASSGVKSPTNDADWITVNGLGGVGFTNSNDIVTGGGSIGANIWKWVNLSQLAGHSGLAVSSTNLAVTFQIGARENGLDIDRLVLGMRGVPYTVANLEAGADGALPDGSAQVNWNDTRQQMDGFGAGVVFLDAGVTFDDADADKLFKNDTTNQLGLTLLRVRIEPNSSWTNSVSGWNGSVNDAKRAALRGAGVLASPWTPPAAMKSSTNTVGGSLLPEQYANYGAYLEKYASNMLANGVSLRAVSLQNEPDWDPSYEGCVWSGAQFLNFFRTNAGVIRSAPVMMPESLGFNFTLSDPSLNDSVAVTNISLIGGHLYGFPNIVAYTNALNKGKRVWQTEYLEHDQSMESAMQTARQVHDCVTTGSMSAYIWWKCLDDDNGLLNGAGVIQRRGYVMSQFSRFVRPGHFRIGETNSTSSAISAYRNPTNNQVAIIAINAFGLSLNQTIQLTNFPSALMLTPTITSPTQSLATLPALNVTNGAFNYTLPANSIITFVGQVILGPPGVASNPSPANGAVGVGSSSTLSWTAGSNAVSHAVYLGTSSNAVAAATPASPEFQGTFQTPGVAPSLAPGQTCYWRVDEIAGANTNAGPIWSFSTAQSFAMLPVADSYVESSTATSNYGSLTNLWVKNNVTLATRAAYLMFDVRALSNVQGATLTLMPNRVDDPAVTMYYEVAATNWTEAGITWNNQPGGTGQLFATNTVSLGAPVTIDVTSLVTSRATNGGLFSLRITQPTNSLNGLIQFCSKECSITNWRPVLAYVNPPNTPPTLAAISNQTTGAGVTLNLTNSATDSDVPAQTLAYSLLTAPTNAVLNSSNGVLTWRALVTQANTTNLFTVRVTDNGSPNLSATQSFVVAVSPLAQPQFSAPVLAGGQLMLQVNGDSGPDYQIQASTNLIDWSVALTTNSPAMPFGWTNGSAGLPKNFFRVQAGPPF